LRRAGRGLASISRDIRSNSIDRRGEYRSLPGPRSGDATLPKEPGRGRSELSKALSLFEGSPSSRSDSHTQRGGARGRSEWKTIFVILRVFVSSWLIWGQALPRRREDAKNRRVFGCGSAALCSSVFICVQTPIGRSCFSASRFRTLPE